MLERSQRLVYRRLTRADRDAFHRLAVDPHVRRHLLDGQVMSREWADAEITGSEALFAEAKVGLWLAASGSDTLGFCGFRRYDELTPEPQLLYALRGDHAGRGLATEMAQALLGHVRSLGWERVVAAVDEPNVASRRVLEKTGFTRCGSLPGAFGEILLFERFEGPAPQRLSCPSGSRMELAVASTWNGDPCEAGEQVRIVLERTPDAIHVTIDAPFFGDPPPPGPPGPTDALWEHEVVELMLLGDGARYLEVELSPHGHHLVLLLEGSRRVVHKGMVIHHDARIEGDRWRAEARLPLGWLPTGCARLNAYAIHGAGAARRFLAWSPPGGERPDFHRLASFGDLRWS